MLMLFWYNLRQMDKACPNCKTPKIVVTAAGDFCLNCGTLAGTKQSVLGKPPAKKVSVAVKTAPSRSSAISNYHKGKTVKAEPVQTKSAKVKANGVATAPLLKHQKVTISVKS